MANRRMFSRDVVETDKFHDMPIYSQVLYFHLGMWADDDGFVSSPKMVISTIGAKPDDLRVLIAKGFIIAFDDGVIVVSHWKQNNYLQKDRYSGTVHKKHLEMLLENNGVYEVNTKCIQSVYGTYTQYSIGENSTEEEKNIWTSDERQSLYFDDVAHICKLLNSAKEKVRSKGRLKPEGGEWIIRGLLRSGFSMDEIKAAAGEAARVGKEVDWYSFEKMMEGSKKGGM